MALDGQERVLLAFSAAHSDVNLLVLLSPALREAEPIRYDKAFQLRTASTSLIM